MVNNIGKTVLLTVSDAPSGTDTCGEVLINEDAAKEVAFLIESKGGKAIALKADISNRVDVTNMIAKAIEKSFNCNRCGIEVIGLEVPHAHLHLIPINNANDLNFNQAKLKLSNQELEKIRDKIVSNL